MKKMMILAAAALLTSCGTSYTDVTNHYVMPAGWEGCQVVTLSSGGSNITAIRCPNSNTSTTYSVGKTKASSAVIEECNSDGCLDPSDKKIVQKINVLQSQLDSLKKQME